MGIECYFIFDKNENESVRDTIIVHSICLTAYSALLKKHFQ